MEKPEDLIAPASMEELPSAIFESDARSEQVTDPENFYPPPPPLPTLNYSAGRQEKSNLDNPESMPPICELAGKKYDYFRALSPQQVYYKEYEQVPWYRRSENVSSFIYVGIFLPPLLWTACFLCLTGDVYYNQVLADGTLSRWPFSNKVAAVIILALQVIVIASRLGASKP